MSDIKTLEEFLEAKRRMRAPSPRNSMAIDALHAKRGENPFELSVAETIERLMIARAEENWPIRDEQIHNLALDFPPWPPGEDAYRSLRLRFGEGREGMIDTFEKHVAHIERVHKKFWRWEHMLSGEHPHEGWQVDRLHLWNLNASHKPTLEWMIVPDLQKNRQRRDVASVQGQTSLADEGLVLAWLFSERVCAINYKKWCGWFLAGYQVNVPRRSVGEPWQRSVPCVGFHCDSREVRLGASWRGDADGDLSVPSSGSDAWRLVS